jgi:hypothetical protein
VFFTSNEWTIPSAVRGQYNNDGKSWWVDAASGDVHSLRSSTDYTGYFNWWWDDHTLAFHEGTGMVFQDIRTGERRFCADRVPARDIHDLDFHSARISPTGIWFLSYGGVSYCYYCYRPNAAAASFVEVKMPASVLPGISFQFTAISSDGRWATTSIWNRESKQQSMICSLETGAAEEIGPLDANALGGYFRESFTADGKAILLCGNNGVGLWDVGQRKLEMLYTASPDSIAASALSPSGKYLCVTVAPSNGKLKGPEAIVVNVATKQARPVWNFWDRYGTVKWLGDDQLLVYPQYTGYTGPGQDYSLWLVSRDGTSKRKVLP